MKTQSRKPPLFIHLVILAVICFLLFLALLAVYGMLEKEKSARLEVSAELTNLKKVPASEGLTPYTFSGSGRVFDRTGCDKVMMSHEDPVTLTLPSLSEFNKK